MTLAKGAFVDSGGLLTTLTMLPEGHEAIRPEVEAEMILMNTGFGYVSQASVHGIWSPLSLPAATSCHIIIQLFRF